MKKTKNEASELRKKFTDILTIIYSWGILIALLAGALSFLGYLIAIIVGGESATSICTFIYRSIYPVLFIFTSCVVLLGLVKMYFAGEKALSNKKKTKVAQEQNNLETVENSETDESK